MALSDPVTGMHGAFEGFGLDVAHLPLPVDDRGDFEDLLEAIAPTVACVVVEPLAQCAGGMRFHDVSVARRIRRACDAFGLLLVFDEIATGFYRTGERFALVEADVAPDIVVLGKALTGGTLPLAATVATEAVFAAFLDADPGKALQHGPTYMGNALACAAANATLDLFERDNTVERVRRLEQKLRDGLAPLRGRRHVRDVRVKGAIGAVEMAPGAAPASEAFARRGAFIRPLRSKHADIVYLMPPLVVSDDDLTVLFHAIYDTVPG